MYGMIKFQDWEVRKETKNSQLCYYYKDEKIDEKELEQYISITKIRKAKGIFMNNRKYSGIIRSGLFSRNNELISIIIPDNIFSIEEKAFFKCKNLKEVIIPPSVIRIGSETFAGCSSLTNIKIPGSISDIEKDTFSECKNLTNVAISNGVTSIGYHAFYNCTNLKDIVIPNSVKNIEGSAFYNCKTLESISIPNDITTIGPCAFAYCSSLKNVAVSDSVINTDDCLCDNEKLTIIWEYAFEHCTELTSVEIPDSIKLIQRGVFLNCKKLEEIALSNSYISINRHAFEENIRLRIKEKREKNLDEIINDYTAKENKNIDVYNDDITKD